MINMNSLTVVGVAGGPEQGFPHWSENPRPATARIGWCFTKVSHQRAHRGEQRSMLEQAGLTGLTPMMIIPVSSTMLTDFHYSYICGCFTIHTSDIWLVLMEE